MFRVCHVFLSGYCSLVVDCWERANLLALLCVMFYCGFVTFPCCVLGQAWKLIVSFPYLCLLTYFKSSNRCIFKEKAYLSLQFSFTFRGVSILLYNGKTASECFFA